MAKSYVVTAPYVTLVTATPQGRRLVGFYRDAPVPGDVDQGVIDRHVEAGMIAEVGKEPEPAPSPAQQADDAARENAEKAQKASPRGGSASKGG